MKEKIQVNLADIKRMSLLGLMMGRIIERSTSNTKGADRVSRIKGRLGVTAGHMSVTLDFEDGSVSILPGLNQPLKAAVVGSLSALLNVSVEQRPIRSFLRGEVSLKGNPLFAFKVLPLFYVAENKDVKA